MAFASLTISLISIWFYCWLCRSFSIEQIKKKKKALTWKKGNWSGDGQMNEIVVLDVLVSVISPWNPYGSDVKLRTQSVPWFIKAAPPPLLDCIQSFTCAFENMYVFTVYSILRITVPHFFPLNELLGTLFNGGEKKNTSKKPTTKENYTQKVNNWKPPSATLWNSSVPANICFSYVTPWLSHFHI